jgi:hypothetical protein
MKIISYLKTKNDWVCFQNYIKEYLIEPDIPNQHNLLLELHDRIGYQIIGEDTFAKLQTDDDSVDVTYIRKTYIGKCCYELEISITIDDESSVYILYPGSIYNNNAGFTALLKATRLKELRAKVYPGENVYTEVFMDYINDKVINLLELIIKDS